MSQVAYCRLAVRPPDTAPAAGFIAVRMASSGATLTVVLNDSLRVEVQPGSDPAPLRAVVQALGNDVPA